jgi:hypothetical protein
MSDIGEAHLGQKEMSGAGSDVPRASRMLRLLEDTEARRRRVTVNEARTAIARALRVPAKTLLNIRKGRRKAVQMCLLSGIRDRLIQVLQAEIAESEHQIAICRQIGLDCREDLFEEAAASLAAAKEILARAIGSS